MDKTMSVEPNEPKKKTRRVLKDKGFAQRLEIACEGNPNCPTDEYRGKQKWIYDNLEKKFGIKVSPEAVRKWFASESEPRKPAMMALAKLLEVDPAWLRLGIKPDMTEPEKLKRNATVNGAVNIVAGLIQSNGGSIAFPDNSDHEIAAIFNGGFYSIEVQLAVDLGADKFRFTPSAAGSRSLILGVIPGETVTSFEIVIIPRSVVEETADNRGGYWDVIVTRRADHYETGGIEVTKMDSLEDLSRALKVRK